ncbi:hypothetical protein J7355_13535 [Endozoicomonas sp. G2_2]|nr:hypothetical protein [Endozoicomonas sp. G2_2]
MDAPLQNDDANRALANLAGWVGIECRSLDSLSGRRLASRHFGAGAGTMTAALRRVRSGAMITQSDRDGVIELARYLAGIAGHDKARYVQQQLSRL